MPSFQITVDVRQRKTRLSRQKLIRWTEKILALVGWKRVALAVRIVNDSEIRALNRRYLGEDRPTDVLAFSQMEGKFFPQRGTPFLGDVVISLQTARRAAPGYGNPWEVELLLYLCHGILHLMGYRDSTPGKRAMMEKKEQAILRKILGPRWRFKKPKRLF